ncbi:MAG: Abi family protein [Bacteroidales bacterium]
MNDYNKQSLTYDQQIKLLIKRGLIVEDMDRILRHLTNISYYRLSAYMLPYKIKDNGVILDKFKEKTSWNMIYDLYIFDRKLRLLIFDAIERLEIAIRTQIIYQLSQKYGSHWQDNPTLFSTPQKKKSKNGNVITIDIYTDIQQHIRDQFNNNKAEVFIDHYKNNYIKPENPPSWMSVEIMYFNHLSRICVNLKNRSDKNGISSHFGLPPDVFCSWLHSINYLRNICAHHSRLWNRDMKIIPEKLSFSRTKKWISNVDSVKRKKVYYFICMLNYLLQTANPTSNFKKRIIDLIDEYNSVAFIGSMGFPANWKEEEIWK